MTPRDGGDATDKPERETAQADDRAYRLRRLLRYTGVNAASVAVDYTIFLSLMKLAGMPVLASTIGHAVAFSLNYVLSRKLVFGTAGEHKGEQRLFAEFMATGLLGLALTASITAAGIYLMDFEPIVAKTVAMLITFVTLYIIRSRLVFTRPN
ncbi:MAG TPA: GtrA family protein [Hyphomicrobium sp.]|uniref:GtrA family protein n=1 Tax=Hyphomicrobium sp. TaxID=82 RepID=UPI002BF3005E|nr:GtrA family protein [Hyphomicrobium sp.]HRN88228.1 GtrA family protein [Hyphomicrobium sp.]